MKLNWNPSKVAFLDFETQSAAELTTTHKYATDPSTRVLTCVIKVDGVVHKFGPYLDAAAKERMCAIAAENVLVAHNAPFDAAIWEYAAKLPEATWCDTLPCAKAAGLPGGLDKLGMVLEGRGKDPNGKRLIDLLCKIRNGKVPAIGPAHDLLMQYNVRDVDLLETVYNRVKGYGEPDVMTTDRAINHRGIPVSREMLIQLNVLFEENKRRGEADFDSRFGVNARSSKQMLEWLETKGFKLPGVNKAAIKMLAEDPDDMYVGDGDVAQDFAVVYEALMMRKEVAGVGQGKAVKALQALDIDDRIREQFVIYGAGPGRWAGRQLQPHNMPSILSRSVDLRSTELTYEGIKAAAAEATASLRKAGNDTAFVPNADILSGMLRHIVQCPMSVADYAQVEARCVAWLADEDRMLDIFADIHRSIYIDMGEKLYGRTISKKDDQYEYVLCKALVLGSTYGMSGAKFAYTCNVRGESAALRTLEATGLNTNDVVKLYRQTYSKIPDLWRRYGEAVMAAVNGHSTETGKCRFYMNGPDLHIELPSGRPIVYRNARVEMMVPAYCALYGMPAVPIPTVCYDTMRCTKGFLYGSKICENVSQATCRDLLAQALVHGEQEGLNPFLHVHDEGAVASEDLDRWLCIMSEQPKWAKGFPILVEGYTGPMWTKNTKGYREGAALNGRKI